MRQIEVFLDQISNGHWQGDQSVWIASDDPAAADQWLPCAGDWMRAVQVAGKVPAAKPAPARKRATPPAPAKAPAVNAPRKSTPRRKTP